MIKHALCAGFVYCLIQASGGLIIDCRKSVGLGFRLRQSIVK